MCDFPCECVIKSVCLKVCVFLLWVYPCACVSRSTIIYLCACLHGCVSFCEFFLGMPVYGNSAYDESNMTLAELYDYSHS